jgi:hypothetical protein
MSREQNAGRSHNIKTGNNRFKYVERLNCLIKPLRVQIKIALMKSVRDLTEGKLAINGAESFAFQSAIPKHNN